MKKSPLKVKDPARVKSGRKSRRKGKRGEYEARDLLQKLFYPNNEGHLERTPMSGAWHGTPIMTGDLVFLRNDKFDTGFPLFFEVKNVRKEAISPFRLLQGECKVLETWLQEAEGKAAKGGLFPILMWKVNNSDWFVMIPTKYIYDLELLVDEPFFYAAPHMRTKDFYLMPFATMREWFAVGVKMINKYTSVIKGLRLP